MRTFNQIKSGQLFTFDQVVYLKHHPQLDGGGFHNASFQMNLADSAPVAEAERLKGFEGWEVVGLFVKMNIFRLN